jgi:phage-related protein
MSSFGGTVKLSGETEYRKALSEIVSNLKVMSSEMQIVTATYGRNDKSVQGLAERNQVLNKQIEAQKEKVEVLTKALEESKAETGESSATTQKWQTELNKATAQLVSMEKEVKDNEETMKKSSEATEDNADEVKELGNESDKAGKKVLSLGDIIKANLISDAIKKGISELVDGMKKLGSMFIDVGKQALESYADYEQLVGGVETLFKDSAGIVQNYANNAYKTAGLSANQYMETVTSFSASLLQSLNGDTAKSAEIADMAITDMADNANKMGTSMESIQNAYQGFAKQNYTMLDNLKLGYGGTKTEMERLLADAEKITGIKYDIKNLNDVYSAIHVIQGELGITGTTAKEASSTIQGSVASLKSAWSNMLVGIADDNANFEGLVDNLVESLITALDNIIPRIEVIIGGIGDMIVAFADEILPKLLEIGMNTIDNLVQGMSSNMPRVLESVNNIISSLISGLTTILPQIANVATQVIMQLVTTLVQNLPQIIECGIQVLLSLIDGLVQTIPDLIPVIVDAVITIVETLIDHLDEIIDAGIQIIFALIDGIIEALPKLIDKMPEIIDKLITAITNNLSKIIQMGITLIIKLAEGLIKAIPQLVSKIPQIITALVKGLANGVTQMASVGLDMIKGLWNGISNSLNWIKDKIKGWVGNVFKFIKKLFGINSPSTLFRDEIGVNLAKGIGVGFSDEMDDVNKEIANAIPTDYDVGVNTTLHNDITSSFNNGVLSQSESIAEAVRDALTGMYVKLDGDKVGEIVVNKVEDVIYT